MGESKTFGGGWGGINVERYEINPEWKMGKGKGKKISNKQQEEHS